LKKWISIQESSILQQSRVKFPFHQFIHREEGAKKVIQASLQNLDSFETNQRINTKTQSHNFIILSGGSGSGKTRASCEIGNILRTMKSERKETHPIFRDTCEIYIDFSNGDSILDDEKIPKKILNDVILVHDKSQIVGLRLFVLCPQHKFTVSFCRKYTDLKKNVFYS
jgi:hypothetical protein